MLYYLIGAVVLVGLLWFVTNTTARAIEHLREGTALRRDLPAPTGAFAPAHAAVDALARSRGYQAAGLTRVLAYPELVGASDEEKLWEDMGAWLDRAHRRMLVAQFVQGRTFHHFITLYRNPTDGREVMVNTTDLPAEFFLPQPPNHYVQAFPGRSLDELLALHEQAEAWLEGRGEYERVLETLPLEVLDRLTRERAGYVTRLPLWKPRLLWWQLTKGRYLNKPVSALYG
ncbi:hypothetical protein Ocepr_0439 [Oceanithermus profundus DSM 14977]|uniref:Uncharacterized protein n=1 Tax=Oceanithermus profundus (strain DSM 14977 / NBRC 100410 / VKM B-2274 / 506) TaxID=670487 RepID=E4U6V5_OCEP5|nr:hypothetical protein [Oceanithermus profundus]ADR35899.1 hypothetical protein Ocepr_0439 [Oceanithermus profundus DSM 14977]